MAKGAFAPVNGHEYTKYTDKMKLRVKPISCHKEGHDFEEFGAIKTNSVTIK